MSEDKASLVVVDANALIDLIKLSALIPVTNIAGYRFLVVEEVVGEIRRPGQAEILKSAIRKGCISTVMLNLPEELALFARLYAVIGRGESASLAYASLHGCLFLSDEKQRAFMREVVALIGEKNLIRTPDLLAGAVKSRAISLAGLKSRVKALKDLAAGPKDRDDLEHLDRVLDRIRKSLK